MNDPAQQRPPPAEDGAAQFPDAGGQVSQAIVSGSADGILAVDEDGIVQACNLAARRLLARSDDQLVGTPFGYPLVAGEASDVDVRLPDGRTRVVEMRTANTTWQNRPLAIASLRDVTKYRQIERELDEALRHQTSIAAITAHELRNPLVAITNCANKLRDPRLTPEEHTETIDRILKHTRHLRSVVHQFLTAARIDAHDIGAKPEPVRVLDILLERLAVFEGRSRAAEIVCAPSVTVQVDRADFSEMVGNYLTNAFLYGRPPIIVEAVQYHDQADIIVRDRGNGVPGSFVPHLFERFSRHPVTQRTTEGTGLGLWIVRSLARANAGDAWYEPDPRGGARFCVRLPAAVPENEAPQH